MIITEAFGHGTEKRLDTASGMVGTVGNDEQNEGRFGRGRERPCVWFKLDVTVKCRVELVYLLNLCLLLINLQVFLLLGCPQSWYQETYQMIGRLDQSSAVKKEP